MRHQNGTLPPKGTRFVQRLGDNLLFTNKLPSRERSGVKWCVNCCDSIGALKVEASAIFFIKED